MKIKEVKNNQAPLEIGWDREKKEVVRIYEYSPDRRHFKADDMEWTFIGDRTIIRYLFTDDGLYEDAEKRAWVFNSVKEMMSEQKKLPLNKRCGRYFVENAFPIKEWYKLQDELRGKKCG